MRRASVLPILLLLFGCRNGLGPANDLSGTWAATFSFPGSSLVLNLSQHRLSIAGSGTYVMEAGGTGTLQVDGSYQRPSLSLSLHYGNGYDQTYIGTVQDGAHIAGALNGYPLPLARQ